MATTTYYLSPITLLIQIFSNIGIQLAGGFVNTYVAGTTTNQVTYTDSTGTTANSDPILLSSAGRMVSASGAPVAVWVASGVAHKVVISDSTGAFILSIDNLTAINDPAAILALLATVSTSGTLGGADIVANAVRSYDVVASVRAAQVPSLASGQTLIIDIEGGSAVNDGGGGFFYWSASSTATDDGLTVIKPTAIATASPGRYLRQSNTFGVYGTFQLTLTGCASAPTVNCSYVKNGNQVTVTIGAIAATSNSTGKGFSGWPATTLSGPVNPITSPLAPAQDNGVGGISSYLTIPTQTGGTNVVLSPNNASGLWTAAGAFQFGGTSFSYIAN